mmetsp:Transcript_103257/g.186343  ORF Transcript_103257/g.186343 Transcript_103257/m.186343 type:complete len:289 (+) Transcript_103257:290-1156(+)
MDFPSATSLQQLLQLQEADEAIPVDIQPVEAAANQVLLQQVTARRHQGSNEVREFHSASTISGQAISCLPCSFWLQASSLQGICQLCTIQHAIAILVHRLEEAGQLPQLAERKLGRHVQQHSLSQSIRAVELKQAVQLLRAQDLPLTRARSLKPLVPEHVLHRRPRLLLDSQELEDDVFSLRTTSQPRQIRSQPLALDVCLELVARLCLWRPEGVEVVVAVSTAVRVVAAILGLLSFGTRAVAVSQSPRPPAQECEEAAAQGPSVALGREAAPDDLWSHGGQGAGCIG